MKKALLAALALTLLFTAGCGSVKQTYVPVSSKEAVNIGIIGNNPALANISVDMLVDFIGGMGKKSDFNEITDNEVLERLKDGTIDIAISFECMDKSKNKNLSMCKISKTDNDSLCIIVRREDTELKSNFETFLSNYETNDELEKLAKQYMSNSDDFKNSLLKPFKFD